MDSERKNFLFDLAQNVILVVFLISITTGVGYLVKLSPWSKWFLVHRIELQLPNQKAPVDEEMILKAADIQVDKATLLSVDLKAVEQRILAFDWIKEVKIEKKYFHTITIGVQFREPKAIAQLSRGALAYVDSEGKIFGNINLKEILDLPLVVGVSKEKKEKIQNSLSVIDYWDRSPLPKVSSLSTILWDLDKGYRLLVSYNITGTGLKFDSIRTMIDLGQEIDESLDEKFQRLANVFQYLSGKSIAVRQVWIDAGKKVVVKTVRGS